jgi:carboxysome shell carbonic anhydrase
MIATATRYGRRPAVPAGRSRGSAAATARTTTSAGTLPQLSAGPRHPLADTVITNALRQRADHIEAAFAEIEPALRALAPRQFDTDFARWANAELSTRVGFTLPSDALAATWVEPLDVRRLYARIVLGTFRRLVDRGFDRTLAQNSDGEPVEALIQRFGFHAVDIAVCADGRLSGAVDYILRVPPAVVVSREGYAGAMFDVEASLRRWEAVELRRFREGRPNAASDPTRYLKIGVYHFSSADPSHGGCAAHGSDTARAASALLERLEQFETAVRQTQCCDATVATLLVGVDTDTDAIRVHVPDRSGRMTTARFVDNAELYERTRDLPREAAKDAIRDIVAACAGVSPDDGPTEGTRWLCGYLLKNNIGQVDAVRSWHGGAYADRGHTERLIVVGDTLDDVQLRNLAFAARMDTLEEGADDLDVGIRILSGLHAAQGFAVPVLVHVRYDPLIPGSDERAGLRAQRLKAGIHSRYAELAATGRLFVVAVVRGGAGAPLLSIDSVAATPAGWLH